MGAGRKMLRRVGGSRNKEAEEGCELLLMEVDRISDINLTPAELTCSPIKPGTYNKVRKLFSRIKGQAVGCD